MKQRTLLTVLFGACLAVTVRADVGDTTIFSDGFEGVSGGTASLTTGPDGNLWFTSTDSIGRITPEGDYTYFSAGLTEDSNPTAICSGPDGNLWFIQQTSGTLGRITPSGTITEFDVGMSGPTAAGYPVAIASGSDGNLWVSAIDVVNGNKVLSVTTTGSYTAFPFPNPGTSPNHLILGFDGHLWSTDFVASAIHRISTSGGIETFTSGITGSGGTAITIGPDGHYWFTQPGNPGKIGRISPLGTVTEFTDDIDTNINGITWGSDGNLWFGHPSKISRITPAGVVTQFSLSLTLPMSFVRGPDGNVWFSSSRGIGRIETGGPPPVTLQRPARILSRRIPVTPDRKVSILVENPNPLEVGGVLSLTPAQAGSGGTSTKRFRIAAQSRQKVPLILSRRLWTKLQKARQMRAKTRTVFNAVETSKVSNGSVVLTVGGRRR